MMNNLALLLCSSAILCGLLTYAQLPAAILIGAILAAVLLASRNRSVVMPRQAFIFAQAVTGLLMAHAVHVAYLKKIAMQWPAFLFGMMSVIGCSYVIGYVIARLRILPGTTALWGAAPGSASTMVLLSDGFDADQRLVAFMSYMRVVLVASVTSLVGHHFTKNEITPVWHISDGSGSLLFTGFTLSIAVILGNRIRLPSAPMLLSLVGSIVLQALSGQHPSLPLWLLAPSYLILGWVIGGRFTRQALSHAWRALPAILTANMTLIAACAVIAWPLSRWLHTTYLAAYLATSPGGSDSVAIIASSLPVDMGLVMAMQVLRLFSVLALAPLIAKSLSRTILKVPARTF